MKRRLRDLLAQLTTPNGLSPEERVELAQEVRFMHLQLETVQEYVGIAVNATEDTDHIIHSHPETVTRLFRAAGTAVRGAERHLDQATGTDELG